MRPLAADEVHIISLVLQVADRQDVVSYVLATGCTDVASFAVVKLDIWKHSSIDVQRTSLASIEIFLLCLVERSAGKVLLLESSVACAAVDHHESLDSFTAYSSNHVVRTVVRDRHHEAIVHSRSE